MDLDPECNTLENESSNEEMVTEKISWANAVVVSSTLPHFRSLPKASHVI